MSFKPILDYMQAELQVLCPLLFIAQDYKIYQERVPRQRLLRPGATADLAIVLAGGAKIIAVQCPEAPLAPQKIVDMELEFFYSGANVFWLFSQEKIDADFLKSIALQGTQFATYAATEGGITIDWTANTSHNGLDLRQHMAVLLLDELEIPCKIADAKQRLRDTGMTQDEIANVLRELRHKGRVMKIQQHHYHCAPFADTAHYRPSNREIDSIPYPVGINSAEMKEDYFALMAAYRDRFSQINDMDSLHAMAASIGKCEYPDYVLGQLRESYRLQADSIMGIVAKASTAGDKAYG